jgi:hypothetical protein
VNRINSLSALSFIAIAALALSVSSAVEAATAKSGGMANTGTAIHQPKKSHLRQENACSLGLWLQDVWHLLINNFGGHQLRLPPFYPRG